MKFPFGILPYFQGICLSFGEGLYLSFREGLQKGGGRLTQFCGSFRNYRVLKGGVQGEGVFLGNPVDSWGRLGKIRGITTPAKKNPIKKCTAFCWSNFDGQSNLGTFWYLKGSLISCSEKPLWYFLCFASWWLQPI